MSILPGSRPQQPDDVTRAVLNKFSVFTPARRRNDQVKVLVARGYYLDSMGRRGRNDRGIYDDAIFVASPDGVTEWNGNSDPSVYRYRVATIDAPQAIRYRPGWHGYGRPSGHNAFRQDSNCTVIRDKIGPDYGMFHVNLHKGSYSTTSSLGCLTVPPQQWGMFYRHLMGKLDKFDQPTFYATVLQYQGGHAPIGEGSAYADVVLEKGDKGALVASLIQNLTALGYYDGVQDSTFGTKTERAITQLQEDLGLVEDGKAGERTLTAIDNAVSTLG
ncbi:MAG: peptidoglycan-binding domain-containing protein [Pseudomonadota bacterium]